MSRFSPAPTPQATYRITTVVSGVDLGPDVFARLIETNVSVFGHAVHVEHVEKIKDGG